MKKWPIPHLDGQPPASPKRPLPIKRDAYSITALITRLAGFDNQFEPDYLVAPPHQHVN